MVNIHPSLLPAYQGLHTHRRALADRIREHGASVHFVTGELDGGPVIAQTRVPVLPDDDETGLAARVLEREHRLLPRVVDWFAAGRLALDGDRVRFDGQPIAEPLRCDD
jgi:phosphoribosylglycinamide formyltransferase-1